MLAFYLCFWSQVINQTLYLLKINRLDLLEKSFGEVLIPYSVYEELTIDKRFMAEAKIVKDASYIKSVLVSNPEAVRILKMATGLDQGESEAIVLTDERKADILLMDEAKMSPIETTQKAQAAKKAYCATLKLNNNLKLNKTKTFEKTGIYQESTFFPKSKKSK